MTATTKRGTSEPQLDESTMAPVHPAEVLLEVSGLCQEFALAGGSRRGEAVHAVSDVSFQVRAGETLALVGESGCGKSSLARAILQIPKPSSGSVRFAGTDLVPLRGKALRSAVSGMQVVFQDPYTSLDPRWTVEALVAEPLSVNHIGKAGERTYRVRELLEAVGLDWRTHGRRRPRELSGGQCQRVAIARALALRPTLLICDEGVSSLDVSIQAQILNLLEDLQARYNLAYLFITHDLAVARRISDRIAVMYLGKFVEVGDSEAVFRSPCHPYTASLVSAIPTMHTTSRERIALRGELPSAVHPPSGCRFRTRCPRAVERCSEIEPELAVSSSFSLVACHFPLEGVFEGEIHE